MEQKTLSSLKSRVLMTTCNQDCCARIYIYNLTKCKLKWYKKSSDIQNMHDATKKHIIKQKKNTYIAKTTKGFQLSCDSQT